MSGKPKYGHITDDQIVDAVRQGGNLRVAAATIGVPYRSLQSLVQYRDIYGRVDDARNAFGAEQTTEQGKNAVAHEPEVSETDRLKQENEELRKVARRVQAGNVMEERILRRLEDGIAAAKPRYQPLPPRRSKRDEHEFVLLFSDTHASEVVSEEGTLGMNRYDWDVMLARMGRIQRAVLSYQENRPYPIRRLNVWMLGDMLSGDIHDELSRTNDRTAEEAAVQFGHDGARWLEEFVPHFEGIKVVGVPGNHPRRSKKPSAKQPFNNGDWTAYQVMRCYHRLNKAFEWDFPLADFALTTVADRWRCLLMHGDGIRSTMPGVPWGGVVRRITTLEQQLSKAKQPLDYVALGHFHTANALDGVGVKTFLNGSVKGVDEYSLKQFGSGRPPSQLLLTFHRTRGVTDVSYLDCEDVVPAGEPALAA